MAQEGEKGKGTIKTLHIIPDFTSPNKCLAAPTTVTVSFP